MFKFDEPIDAIKIYQILLLIEEKTFGEKNTFE